MSFAAGMTFKDAAKLLDIKGVGQNKLINILESEKIIFKQGDHYLPIQKYLNFGYFTVKQNPININYTEIPYIQIYITQKGLKWLAKTLSDKGYKVKGNVFMDN